MLLMTVFSLGAGITSVRGSIGGATFSKPLGITVGTTRRKAVRHPRGPRIPILKGAALAWRHMSPSGRAAWRTAVHANTILFGHYYSGYQAFTACWGIGQPSAFTPFTGPSSSGHAIADYAIISSVNSWSSDSCLLAWTDAITSDQAILIVLSWGYTFGSTRIWINLNNNLYVPDNSPGDTSYSVPFSFWDSLGAGGPGDIITADMYGFDTAGTNIFLYNWKKYASYSFAISP